MMPSRPPRHHQCTSTVSQKKFCFDSPYDCSVPHKIISYNENHTIGFFFGKVTKSPLPNENWETDWVVDPTGGEQEWGFFSRRHLLGLKALFNHGKLSFPNCVFCVPNCVLMVWFRQLCFRSDSLDSEK